MILREASKTEQLVPCKVREGIASILLEEFFDSLGCIEEDVVWWSFGMKDLVGEISRSAHIWTKDKYAEFIGRLSKLEVKKKVLLRLANVEEDEEEENS